MQHHAGRIHTEVLIGHDAGVEPAAAGFIVHHEHMVGENAAEAELALILGLVLEYGSGGDGNGLHADTPPQL